MRMFKHNPLISWESKLRGRILRLWYRSRLECRGAFRVGSHCKVFIDGVDSRISTGCEVELADYVHLQANGPGQIMIGDNVQINSYSRIIALAGITIGSNVAVAQFVTILDHDHAYHVESGKLILPGGFTAASITIGSNVWIGDKVTILKGSRIGDNVIVAAHTLVNGDVPSNSIVGGTPFKVIKKI